ncbi:MAG TPA: BON domain-containing protein [Acidisarcina sp.]|nr:BON domain-containing protein [Acidisarcina sp.]
MTKVRIGYTGILAVFLWIAPIAVPAHAAAIADEQASSAAGQNDSQIQTDINKQLGKSRFQGIQATVQNGVITLSGTTSLYEYKQDADKKAHHVKNVVAVRNQIEVGGKEISDQELGQALAEKLQYDRVGYGNVFNAIKVSVQNGVVTLGGSARTPMDKDSALSLVSNYPGVKDVIDDIEVLPPSPMDDRIRLEVARAVYGYPTLNKYAIDPAKPIRIAVDRGNVELYGVVDSQADKDTAFIRANGVPGVFKVTNNLVVANQPTEKKKK